MLTLITSMNAKLFVEYGRSFLASWIRHAGSDVRLVICAEGEIIELAQYVDNIKVIACQLDSPAQKLFQAKYGRFFQANGLVPVKASQVESLYKFKYDYRYDAVRFAFKAFSYQKSLKELELGTRFVGWIDSDVVCLRDFNLSGLSEMLPRTGEIASYLGRTVFPQPTPYSECGFLAFDYQNEVARAFIDDFISMYETGEIFLNPEWHDCIAFDVIRHRYQLRGYAFRNLSGQYHDNEHPFIKSPLGRYFDHLKGPRRKARGRS